MGPVGPVSLYFRNILFFTKNVSQVIFDIVPRDQPLHIMCNFCMWGGVVLRRIFSKVRVIKKIYINTRS